MADLDEFENRFAHLLAPIKDLQKNWDIDLSALLTDYLNELENVEIDVMMHPIGVKSSQMPNTQQRAMNFAEAALLIQGSTHVYSKKVEYLYELVFKFLELLSKKGAKNNRQNQNDTATNQNNRTNRAGAADEADDSFQSLDDLQVNNNVDLKETDENLLNEKAPKLITPMPLALVPLEDFEKSNVPLVSKTGEVIGKKDDYRVNTCYLHTSGVLLLDLLDAKLIDVPDAEGVALEQVPSSQLPLQQTELPPPIAVVVNDAADDNAAHDSPEAADDYPEGPSPFMPAETSTFVGALDEPLAASTPAPGVNKKLFLTPLPVPETRVAEKQNLRTKENLEKVNRSQIIREAWTELNEYDVEGGPLAKPIRKRKTFKIPSCFFEKEEKNAKRQGVKRKFEENDDTCNNNNASTTVVEAAAQTTKNNNNNDLPKETLAEFFKNVVFNKRRNFPKNPLKVPLYGELDDLFWEEQKRRRMMRMNRGQLAQKNNNNNETNGRFTNIRNKDGGWADVEIDESQLDRNLKGIFEGPDDEDDVVDDNAAAFDDNGDAEPVAPAVVLTEEDFLPPELGTAPSNVSEISSSGVNFETYEEYVKYKVEQHLRKAQEFAAISDLAKRVQDWEERIEPFLSVEEQRRLFDIRVYGDEILEFFTQNKTVQFMFREFSAAKPQWEVCRYFLAALMLANQGNVDLSEDGEFETSLNTMKLKFLSAERQYVQLENYLAPSVQEKR